MLLVRPPYDRSIARATSPFSARLRAMGLHVTTVEAQFRRNRALSAIFSNMG